MIYCMKEPKIIQMDWKALGYEKVWVDGKVIWISQQDKSIQNSRTSKLTYSV